MNKLGAYISDVTEYIPESVRSSVIDAAGLSKRIDDDSKHITCMALDTVFLGESRQILCVGYTDGFQVYDYSDPALPREIVSRQDLAVQVLRMLPIPIASKEVSVSPAPVLAVVHSKTPTLVKLYSLTNDEVAYVIRCTQSVRALQASRRVLAVGQVGVLDLYDAVSFARLFTVPISTEPQAPLEAFALGTRWLAYNSCGDTALPQGWGASVWDKLSYVGQVGQQTFDRMLLPANSKTRQGDSRIVIRDVSSQTAICVLGEQHDSVSMRWDPSGLLLASSAYMGHTIILHRAMIENHKDSQVTFQHVLTLNRGITPAVISDLAISDDASFLAASTVKGTTHIFPLTSLGSLRGEPPSPVKLAPTQQVKVVNATARIKLGSALLTEGLHPKVAFRVPRGIMIASRIGQLSLYSLHGGAEMLTNLVRVSRVCRPHLNFTEKLAGPFAFAPYTDISDKPEDPVSYLGQVETITHAPVDVPLWNCPQLKFFCFTDIDNVSVRKGVTDHNWEQVTWRAGPTTQGREVEDVEYSGGSLNMESMLTTAMRTNLPVLPAEQDDEFIPAEATGFYLTPEVEVNKTPPNLVEDEFLPNEIQDACIAGETWDPS